MERILDRRFAPFNFSIVHGFPNVVPAPNEWNDYFRRFREHKEDNPTQHLKEFHELMHQREIHHEDVLMNIFRFSLARDACEWYHSLPLARISSPREFHTAFSRHCQRHYSSKLICHNCCEEYEGHDQDLDVSYESCGDEDHEEEEALRELMELVKSLSAKLERLESEESTEDFPVHEEDVPGIPTEDDDEDSIVAEALHSAPVVLDVSTFDDNFDEEQ
jgi:hypothetical protein